VKNLSWVSIFLPLALLSPPATAAQTLFQDTFDGETLLTPGLYSLDYTGFAQWNVIGNSVDITVLPNGFIVSPGNYGPGQAASSIVVDLNGSQALPGTIETKSSFTFVAGGTYTLHYAFGNARAQSNSALVEIPGLVSETRTQSTTNAFTSYSTTFVPATTTTAKLRFTSLGGNDQDGLLLDNVSITSPSSAPAESPLGILALGLGLAAAGALVIKRSA
jgi:hypothetical protein